MKIKPSQNILFIACLISVSFSISAIPLRLLAGQTEKAMPAQDATAHYYRGKELDQQGRYDEAIVELKKALEIDPKFAKAHLMLGVEYTQKGMHGEAINEYKTAISLGMDNANMAIAHYDLGVGYWHKGMLKEAESQFELSAKLDPNFKSPKSALNRIRGPSAFRVISGKKIPNIFMTFFIPFVILLVFGIQFFRHARLKRVLGNLKNYFKGNVIGGNFSSPEFEGMFQGKRFNINFRNYGRNEEAVLEICIYTGPGFNLEIKHENILTMAGEKMGLVHEVKINVPQFDNKYLITSKEPIRAMSYLQNPGVRNSIDNIFAKGFQSFTADAGSIKIQKIRYSLKNDLRIENLTNILQNLIISRGQESPWQTEKPSATVNLAPPAFPLGKNGFFIRIIFMSMPFLGSLLVLSSVLILASASYDPPNWLKVMAVFSSNISMSHSHYTWEQIRALRQEGVWNVMPIVVIQLIMAAFFESIFVFGMIKQRKIKSMFQSSKFGHFR